MLMRSLLFAPANRRDLLAKFPTLSADAYSPDLEDGTPPGEREGARAALAENLKLARGGRTEARFFVRVNPVGSPDFEKDLAAARAAGADGLVLPKAERPADIAALGGGLPVIAGIESIRGVIDVMAIAACPGVAAVYFGAEDFAADMGARRTPDGLEVLYARSQVVLAAKAAGVKALDQVVIDIRDDDLFRSDARAGRDLGYDGKMCLLPRQIGLAHEVFGPSAAEIDHATRLVAAYEAAQARGAGTIDFEGRMVDGPVLKAAQAILAAEADRSEPAR
ncbi:HpcH/HpaI aldolase/citrate lyase family protein [uncultured Enterovirga sp.]|uniref:HpcH/HpaI aldolase/citrate lyase family protein n=1 Tax=uncultured Enterovirga sp. TaxID=2026352 RepID=UPI0035CB5464